MAYSLDENPPGCPRCGERYEPGKVKVDFMHCDCPGAGVGRGHTARWCLRCGWYNAPGHAPGGWYRDPGVIRVKD